MKKQSLKLLFALAAALAGTFAQAEPSRLFSQELGEVTKDISVDLDYNSTATGRAAWVSPRVCASARSAARCW